MNKNNIVMDETSQQLPLDQQTGVAPEHQGQITFQDDVQETHPELINLATALSEEKLNEIAQMCYEEYQDDENSRKDWMTMQSEWVNIYYQKAKPKNPPWPGSSDESIPLLMEGCNQFHARAYKAFFAKQNFVIGYPIGHVSKQDKERADRIGKYMSWQLDVQDKNYRRNKDRLLRALPLHGSFFTKTYRDQINKRNVVENVRAADMVVSYYNCGLDIEDVERKTQIIDLPLRKAKFLYAQQFFSIMPEEYSGSETNEIQQSVNEAIGIVPPSSSRERPVRILEQHRYLDLDGDGIEEPYIVWLCAQSQKILRIAIRWATDAFGTPVNNKKPLEYFTHYVYLENPDGFYGLGLGHLTGDLNKAVNRILRQTIDAATLQNLRPGFASKSLGIRKGFQEFQLGKITTVDGSMDDIRKGLMFLDHPGPSQALLTLMDALVQKGDRLNMVTDMLTGQAEKVYQPTTATALIEQGLMTFSAVQTRIHAALEQELAKIYRLNGLYLDDQIYITFNDAQKEEEIQIFRNDFTDNVQVKPGFDPTNSSEDVKIRKAQMEYETLLKNPLVMNSPTHLSNATRRFLEALGSVAIDDVVPNEQFIQQKQQEQAQVQAQQAQAQAANGQNQQEPHPAQLQLEQMKLQQKQQEIDIKQQSEHTKQQIEIAKIQQDGELKRREQDLKAQGHQLEMIKHRDLNISHNPAIFERSIRKQLDD